jgi:hypothetical protein
MFQYEVIRKGAWGRCNLPHKPSFLRVVGCRVPAAEKKLLVEKRFSRVMGQSKLPGDSYPTNVAPRNIRISRAALIQDSPLTQHTAAVLALPSDRIAFQAPVLALQSGGISFQAAVLAEVE